MTDVQKKKCMELDSTHAKARYLWLRLRNPSQSVLSCEVWVVGHRNMHHSNELDPVFPWLRSGPPPTSATSYHLQHCFFSTWSSLLQRGQVWCASLKLFMKKGIRQQHSTNLRQSTWRLKRAAHTRDMNAHDQSGLSRAPTRSRWRASTWATRTSRLCRWRWSWPAAGSWCTSSCRRSSPAPCRSWRTSVFHPWAQGLDWRSLLFVLQRSKVGGCFKGTLAAKKRCILRSCGWVYLAARGRFPEGWMGCGGGKPSHYLLDHLLEQRQTFTDIISWNNRNCRKYTFY